MPSTPTPEPEKLMPFVVEDSAGHKLEVRECPNGFPHDVSINYWLKDYGTGYCINVSMELLNALANKIAQRPLPQLSEQAARKCAEDILSEIGYNSKEEYAVGIVWIEAILTRHFQQAQPAKKNGGKK